MKIALAQIDTTIGDFAGNVDLIVKYAECARERGADLVVFPELALCGYPPRDLVEKPGFVERSQSELIRLARKSAPHPRAGGLCAPFAGESRQAGGECRGLAGRRQGGGGLRQNPAPFLRCV